MPKLQTGGYSLSQIFITCQRVIRENTTDNQLFIYDINTRYSRFSKLIVYRAVFLGRIGQGQMIFVPITDNLCRALFPANTNHPDSSTVIRIYFCSTGSSFRQSGHPV